MASTSSNKFSRRLVDFPGGHIIEFKIVRSSSPYSIDQVNKWFNDIIKYTHHPRNLVVDGQKRRVPIGLAIKKALRKVVLIQLCHNTTCLLFKIDPVSGYVQPRTRSIFNDDRFTFVGMEIKRAAKRLKEDYRISLSSTSDVGEMAAERWKESPEVREAGQRELLWKVFRIKWETKSKEVRESHWERDVLTKEQVDYACREAFASFILGQKLLPGTGTGSGTGTGKVIPAAPAKSS